MRLTEADIRERCSDAVFERGETYRSEGHIQQLDRFGDVLSARVQGSRLYDVTVDLTSAPIEPDCTCPYDGPGDCKHVVAVLLDVVEDSPPDESEHLLPILDDCTAGELRAFLTDELARNPSMRDRFRARFADDSDRTVADYRAEVDALFDRHTAASPVVTEAIDFSPLTDLAEQHRARERYRAAATVHRALAAGITANMNRVDAAHDHYATEFQSALDGYVACVSAADLDPAEYESYVEHLAEQASTAPPPFAERYEQALDDLRSG